MYFVNEEQIGSRLAFLQRLAETARELAVRWQDGDAVLALAQERALHLAIEGVTDVGSLLIDAFILRDASSYEDIVDILRGEGAFDPDTAGQLLDLVKLRRPLVQDYTSWDASGLHALTLRLPELLPRFVEQVRAFMAKELGGS
ncbi:hypothetical protein SD70_22495 [Gordoniibacillus kamchatkensis]|uniref:DUF86 domain-containing protein n=1 Tax=Gordoniibacillus kamchatkensis TaxID=1590651 RepID=A0ABR5ADH8_9BACL|nr:HepT-like ribonuclease domain-containing protein [Paenibacillus sp. VKM B-2647]KIL39089.1 hypothetical protein SD70_22495 [Paenibacillus sp. VKM B-2647]